MAGLQRDENTLSLTCTSTGLRVAAVKPPRIAATLSNAMSTQNAGVKECWKTIQG